MDAVDIKILRTMGIYPFLHWPHPPQSLKPGFIAKRVGRSIETVKDRIGRLEKSGVILGYEIFPNFGHLDLSVMGFHFRVRDSVNKTRAIEEVYGLDGVMSSWNFQGPTVCFEIGYRDVADLERKLQRLASSVNAENVPYACYKY